MKKRTVQLGDVCEVNPGQPRGLTPDTPCSFVPMEAVDDWSARIMSLARREVKDVGKGYTAFAENDVLLANITPCMENGKCAIARGLLSGIGFGTTEFHVLRASDHVLPEWLYYYWRLPETRRRAERAMTGSAGQKRVPTNYLESLQIPLPSLSEQWRISAMLAQADQLRCTRRYALDLSESFLPAAFLEMFGDPVENPNRHPLIELGQLLAKRPSLGTTRPCTDDGCTRCVRVGEIGGTGIDLAACACVNLTESEIERYRVLPGDILLARAIGSEDHLGKLSVCQSISETLVSDSHCMRVRPDPEKLSVLYLATLLGVPSGRALFMREARRTAVQFNINCEQLSEITIPIPPLALQQRFADLVRGHERLRATQRESLSQAVYLFQSLLLRAFEEGQDESPNFMQMGIDSGR